MSVGLEGFPLISFFQQSVCSDFRVLVSSQAIVNKRRGGPAAASVPVVVTWGNLGRGRGHCSGREACDLRGI